ncbi:aminopeptidase N [Pedobacter sp. AK017]|uniref:M1 family metallopeptidase n=1 Tax=Pedobacter sp. AK017 TaxID=2723073 RepID=UPI001607F3A7|nr:M1 family metallopeptidase [Pedobacter sp. AK017]MBB5438682.1 aminopeptidase N [Pedobacter sp. AK017]
MKPVYCAILTCLLSLQVAAQLMDKRHPHTAADTLRGMLSPLRTSYDINYYHLDISLDIANQAIKGSNEFHFTATQRLSKLQFDLFENMDIEKIIFKAQQIPFTRKFNAVFVSFPQPIEKGSKEKFTVFYSGKPVIAKNPPWEGGFIFSKDKSGKPWVSVACQGLGASSWWPNKDHQSDEADSMLISVTVPKDLQEISNGRLRSKVEKPNGQLQYNWFVNNPINNYNVTLYVGRYAHWADQYAGEKGELSLDYWALKEDSAIAVPHWNADVKLMLKSFEHWFGPYPFYQDGYKLVQAPYLGMEHQSAIAYGNGFKKGYLGSDLSNTGWGLKFDFITIHESGHEWFGNNITTKDIADMWVHEAFTNYAEALFLESNYGKKAGAEYITGIRKNIRNDSPIIGTYNLNREGSGDMYYKGANLVHLIRQLINDDEKFRSILRGLNKTFYHKTVTTQQVEEYIIRQSGLNLQKTFDQYLRHTGIPTLEYQVYNGLLKYRWAADVKNFDMPVKVSLKPGNFSFIYPSANWKTIAADKSISNRSFKAEPNFYIQLKAVN